VHLVIYLLVLVTTLTGWFYAAMRGWTLVLFGVVPLPGLVSQGSALGRTLGQLHGKLIWVLLAAIVVHVIAALVHLFVYRDRVMQRMLPAAIAAKI
jgi:cytochrome b561